MREQSGEVTGQQQRLDVQIGVSFDFFFDSSKLPHPTHPVVRIT
jgi:hypothetical protein